MLSKVCLGGGGLYYFVSYFFLKKISNNKPDSSPFPFFAFLKHYISNKVIPTYKSSSREQLSYIVTLILNQLFVE